MKDAYLNLEYVHEQFHIFVVSIAPNCIEQYRLNTHARVGVGIEQNKHDKSQNHKANVNEEKAQAELQ